MTIEQDHVEGALAPRSGLIGTDRIGDACGGASAEPGGILFGPF
jgi:hypothetical protein